MDMETQYLIETTPDLSQYKSPAGAAKALHRHLTKIAESWGMYGLDLPQIYAPNERGEVKSWWVVWESGPSEWGTYFTGYREDAYTPNWYCELYWGFDMIFVKD